MKRLMLQQFRSLGFPKIQIPNLFSSTSKSFPHFLALFFSTYIFYLISTLQERLRSACVYVIKVFHGEHGEIYCGFWFIYYLDYCYLYFLILISKSLPGLQSLMKEIYIKEVFPTQTHLSLDFPIFDEIFMARKFLMSPFSYFKARIVILTLGAWCFK